MPDLRCFLFSADRTFSVHGCTGVEDPLRQVDEGVVLVADCQTLGLEQNADLSVIGHTQRAVGSHQGLEQLPLTVSHSRVVPVKGLQGNTEKAFTVSNNTEVLVRLNQGCQT